MANITLRLLRRCRQSEVVNILSPSRTRLISTTPCLKPKDDLTAPNKSPAPTLVYAGTLDKQVYRIKVFSLASSAVIMSSQPLLWTKLTALNSVIMQVTIRVGRKSSLLWDQVSHLCTHTHYSSSRFYYMYYMYAACFAGPSEVRWTFGSLVTILIIGGVG